MHRERVLKALAQLLVGVENKLHLADRRRRRHDNLMQRNALDLQRIKIGTADILEQNRGTRHHPSVKAHR